MSSEVEHIIDRRTRLLAEAILHEVDVRAAILSPVGGRPPFTDQITTEESFRFWSKQRYEPAGKAAVGRMTPTQVAELDAWLAQEVNARQNPRPLLP